MKTNPNDAKVVAGFRGRYILLLPVVSPSDLVSLLLAESFLVTNSKMPLPVTHTVAMLPPPLPPLLPLSPLLPLPPLPPF
jgi:hypothetical protein